MKHYSYFFCLFISMIGLLESCRPKAEFPSPLEDLVIDDVILDADKTQHTISVESFLTGVAEKTTDVATGETPDWLTVTVANQKIDLKLRENISINDRKAMVVLFVDDGLEHTSYSGETVVFYVTQLKNKQFEGIDIEEVSIGCERKDTVITLPRSLRNVKTVINGLDGEQVNWCSAQLSSDRLTLKVNEHRTLGERQALIKLLPSTNGAENDSTAAQFTFLLTQNHNPVLDSLNIGQVTLSYDGKKQVVKTNRLLTGIKAQIVDVETQSTASWCKVAVAGDSISVSASTLNGFSDRSALVTLYLPNGNNPIDSTTIQHSFKVVQQHRSQIVVEKGSYEVAYNEKELQVAVTSNMEFKATTASSEKWVTCEIEKNGTTDYLLHLKFDENKGYEQRKDTLTLTATGNSDVKASVVLIQKTDPTIVIFESNIPTLEFGKGGGEFQLPVSTKTKNYQIVNNASWISVGAQVCEEAGKYHHKITIKNYAGEGPERRETIIVKNNDQQQSFVVMQHKYIYFTETEKEIEVGTTQALSYKNHTSRSVTWKSSNEKVAVVDQQGNVTALSRGTANIYASLGEYKGIPDYNDYCKVTVYSVTDKVTAVRGYGDYQKNEGYVTANCPIIITNNYNKNIILQSVVIVGDNGKKTIASQYTEGNPILSPGGNVKVVFEEVKGLYKPQVVIKFSTQGQQYEKRVDY